VSAEASIAAFNALDAWVRALAVPEEAQAPKGLEAMTGCAMVLRLDHHMIGRAAMFGGPEVFTRAARLFSRAGDSFGAEWLCSPAR
jgi:hypothetical protein